MIKHAPLLLAAFAFCGCGVVPPPRTVDLARTARVTFPFVPDSRASLERVDGRDVLVASASYMQSRSEDPHRNGAAPTVLSACVMKFDEPVFQGLGDRDRAAFVAGLRDVFGELGTITALTPVEVAGLPGYEVAVDRAAPTGRWRSKSYRRDPAVRTLVRVALGRTSLSFFSVTFTLRNRADEVDAVESFDALVASSSLKDGAPPPADGAPGNDDRIAGALKALSLHLGS